MILPSRPLRIDESALRAQRRKSWRVAAALTLFGIGCAAMVGWETRSILRERAILDGGAPVRLTRFGGKVEATSKLGVELFYEYKLQVAYLDPSGTERTAPIEFTTFWKPVDEQVQPTVKVLPDDPLHPAITWASDAGGWRLWIPILFSSMFGLMVYAVSGLLRRTRRRELALRACAEESEELTFPLVFATQNRGTWTVKYQPEPGKTATDSATEAPLVVVRDGRQHVVALRSTSTGPVLLRASLAEFQLSPEERRAIGERLQAA